MKQEKIFTVVTGEGVLANGLIERVTITHGEFFGVPVMTAHFTLRLLHYGKSVINAYDAERPTMNIEIVINDSKKLLQVARGAAMLMWTDDVQSAVDEVIASIRKAIIEHYEQEREG